MPQEGVEPMPRGSFVAAGSLLAVACFNPSLSGSIFLLFFLAWATIALPFIHSPRGVTAAKALWSTAATVAGIAFGLQIGVQLAYFLRTPGIRKHAVAKTLEILGFSRIETGYEFLTRIVLVAIAFAVLTHQATTRRRRRPPPAAQLQHRHEEHSYRRASGGLSEGSSILLVVLSMLGIAFLRPALISLPHIVALSAAAFTAATGTTTTTQKSSQWLVTLQLYASGHLSAIYVWQWALFYAAPLRALADFLGIFILDFKNQSVVEFTQEVAVCALLAVLITTLAYLRSQNRRERSLNGGSGRGVAHSEQLSEENLQEVTEPLLEAEDPPGESKMLVLVAWNALFSHAGPVAAVVCGVALVQPSIIGAALLVGSLLVLVQLPRKSFSNSSGNKHIVALEMLFWVLFLWLTACYIATALPLQSDGDSSSQLSSSMWLAWFDALGVHVFSNGAPLFAIFISISAVSTYIYNLKQEHTTTTTASSTFQNFRAVQALDVVLACIVPVAVFVIGVASYNVMHVVLLFGLVGTFLTRALQLKPLLLVDANNHKSPRGVQLLRVYSALVVLTMYVVSLAGLDVFGSVLDPLKYQGILQILGLWHPSSIAMMSFALLLALAAVKAAIAEAAATAPCSLVQAAEDEVGVQQQQQVPRVNGVLTWRLRWQLLLARKTSTYGAVVLAIVLYCLVLFNCEVAFIGLAYMVVAVVCLAVQPQKGRWRAVDTVDDSDTVLKNIILGVVGTSCTNQQILSVSAGAGNAAVELVDSSLFSWIPLCCGAILATLDFLVQALFPAVSSSQYFDIPDDVLDFLENAVGVDVAPTGRELALQLMRPVLVLSCMCAFRKLYSLGVLHRQLAHAALHQDEYDQLRLAKQWSAGAFVKRFLILHASKVVVVVAFAAAMQDPSVLGWILVVGAVLIPPSLHSTNTSSSAAALNAALVAAYSLSSLWLLAQYTIQISWIKSFFLSTRFHVDTQDLLAWLGIDPSSNTGTDPAPPSLLESLLRWKALLLAAVSLNQKVLIWWTKLPDVVRNEAKCGAKCPLFWPPTPNFLLPVVPERFNDASAAEAGPIMRREESELAPGTGAVLSVSGEEPQQKDQLRTARVALHTVAQKARTLAQQALTAVDWPSSPRPSTENDQEAIEPSEEEEQQDTETTSSQLTAFRFALQDWIERCYDDWGLEFALFTLLVAAFIAANALSLVYLAAVAIGMVVPSRPRRVLWSWLVLPVLGVILLWQYSELVGLPPTTPPPPTEPLPSLKIDNEIFLFKLKWDPASPLAEDVKAWLGLVDIDPQAVWALFIAYCATVLKMYCDRQHTLTRQSSLSIRTNAAQQQQREDSTLTLPLLHNFTNNNNTNTLQGEPSFFTSPYAAELWAPLEYSAQHRWKWHDWVRYTVYRRSLDFLLVAVVALCTLDNDIIHAGYLALALFFFRSRMALRVKRNSMFAWLPLYNFTVMAIVLAYQAPFEDVWDWPLDDGTSCTLAHLLGLYKLHPPSSAAPSPAPSPSLAASLSNNSTVSLPRRSSLLSWGYEGSIADLILWVFIRLQSHLFASPTYRQVVAVAEAEESQERADRKAEVAEWKQSQAAAAIEESGQRAARALRISRIKGGVDRNLKLLFGNNNKEEEVEESGGGHLGGSVLDFDFLDIGTGNRKGSSSTFNTTSTTAATRQRRPPLNQPPQGAERRQKTAPRPSAAMLTEYERTVARISEIEAEAHVESNSGEAEIPSSYLETAEKPHHRQNTTSSSSSTLSWIGSGWRWLTAFIPRRADRRESALAYTLFVFAYLSDLSLLTMVLPLSAFIYALISVRPARAYWHAVLIYCEAIIVSSYAFQVPSRLYCGFISPQLERTAEMLGIHANAARCIPLFFVYLATLRHTHGLLTYHAAGARAAAAAEEEALPGSTASEQRPSSSQFDLERGALEMIEGVDDFEGEQENTRQQSHGDSGAAGAGGTSVNNENVPSRPFFVGVEEVSWVTFSIEAISKAAAAICEFILTACAAQCERSPSFLLVELQRDGTKSTGSDIEKTLQRVLDIQRARDLATERFKRRESSTNISSESWQGLVTTTTTTGTASSSKTSLCSLASMGPIKLRFHSFLDESVLPPRLPQKNNVAAGGEVGEQTEKEEEENNTNNKTQNVLLEVIPLQCTPQNTPDVCTVPGWPLRSLCPAATAATVLVSSPTAAQEENVTVVAAEPHGRQARDFYAVTAVLDILAFIFVAVYYNRVVQAAGSLSEITSQHVVPLGYLLTLMTLFMFIVMDRVFYTLGNAAGKVVLHLTEMALFFWYCSSLVWDPPDYYSSSSGSSSSGGSSTGSGSAGSGFGADSAVPRDHLRVLLALKSASFALSALQLRTGYPPPASYANGMGRHTFVFMRSVSIPASLAFHAFTAVPFLYEMRQLLDWACTATTLTLYDWLKLEDINMSLYFAAVMRATRAQKPHGMRQPRYLKFFQGTLLFSLLLVLLWVPLLVFSTGNPTYQVPSLAAFSVNVTLQASSAEQGLRLSSPLFHGGDRGTWLQWINTTTQSSSSGSGVDDGHIMPPALAADYAPEQLLLLCTPPDADALWTASPPARHALTFVLESNDADVAISFGWNVQRDLPPASEHGGPSCAGTEAIALAKQSRIALLQVLQGEASSAPLLRKISFSPTTDQENSTSALFPAFWLMRGDACTARPLQQEDIRGAREGLPSRKRRVPTDVEWADRWLACNASLGSSIENHRSSSTTSSSGNRDITTNGDDVVVVAPTGSVWWKLACSIVDSQGSLILLEEEGKEILKGGDHFDGSAAGAESEDKWPIACPLSSTTSSSPLFTGPRIVVLLDRVQGGIIGATINKFGVVGLYTVFVYGIGRFLRLSVTNLRMRIPFEDLPTTRRLVALCQDIYIARAEGLLGLEEELYGALITVYRLPHVLFALTKKNK